MFEAIATGEERLELARRIAKELKGKTQGGLTITNVADYIIVDDEQDRWIDSEDNFNESAEDFLNEVLGGKYDRCEDYLDTDWYTDFCQANACIYSHTGMPSDIDDLIDAIEEEYIFEVFEALGIEDEELPAMIKLLASDGPMFIGDDAAGSAHTWIDEGFDAESAKEWIEAGVWNPNTASVLRYVGLTGEDVDLANNWMLLKVDQDKVSPYEISPIHSVCNGDVPVQELIAATANNVEWKVDDVCLKAFGTLYCREWDKHEIASDCHNLDEVEMAVRHWRANLSVADRRNSKVEIKSYEVRAVYADGSIEAIKKC